MSGVHVAAEKWIRPLPVGRGEGRLDPLAKDVLREVWGYVAWEIQRDPARSERPWVSRDEIAASIGSSPSAVAKQIRKLSALGWMRWDGRRWALAWMRPWPPGHAVSDEPGDQEVRPGGLEGPPDPAVSGPSSPRSRTFQSSQPVLPVLAAGPSSPPDQGSHDSSHDQPPSSDSTPSPRESIERQLLDLVVRKGVAGTAPGASFVAPMVERVEDGCTVEDVGRVIDEWKRRRDMGDRAQGRLSALFYLRSWPRTRIEYLGERPTAARAPAARAPSIADEWAEFERQGQPT